MDDNEHIKYIESDGKTKCSELGKKVATFLGRMFMGLHHVESKALRHERVHWGDQESIGIVLYAPDMATFDFDNLTRIVVLSHDMCLRVALRPVSPRYMEFCFHDRKRDDGKMHMFERMPTLEDHMAKLREGWWS